MKINKMVGISDDIETTKRILKNQYPNLYNWQDFDTTLAYEDANEKKEMLKKHLKIKGISNDLLGPYVPGPVYTVFMFDTVDKIEKEPPKKMGELFNALEFEKMNQEILLKKIQITSNNYMYVNELLDNAQNIKTDSSNNFVISELQEKSKNFNLVIDVLKDYVQFYDKCIKKIKEEQNNESNT